MVNEKKENENTINNENNILLELAEKKLITSMWFLSIIEVKLITNQSINGIKIAELNFKKIHFFVELFILQNLSS